MTEHPRRNSRVNPVKVFLRRSAIAYLDAKGVDAGYLAEWKEFERERIRTDPEVADTYKVLNAAMLDGNMEVVWRSLDRTPRRKATDPKPADEDEDDEDGEEHDDEDDDPGVDLFSIAGMQMKPFLRYADAGVPGGFRTVMTRHATVAQGFGQAQVTATQAGHAQRAATRQLKQANEALRRAGNVATELLYNVRDTDDAEFV